MITTHQTVELKPNCLLAIEKLCPTDSLLIFDIETTGFHRLKDQIVSVTCLYQSSGTMKISQWFAETVEDEKALLVELKPYFDSKAVHITYNGHSFDIPFLNTKYKYYNISTALNKSKCYDLYRIAKKALQLNSYKLKQIEEALGINREDQISGKDCTLMYQDYQETRDRSLAELILMHNYEDVLNLAELLPLVDRLDELALNSFKIVTLNYLNAQWYLQTIKQQGSFLQLSFWCYNEHASRLKPQSLFLADGGSLTLESVAQNESVLAYNLSVYSKELQGAALLCLDLQELSFLNDEDYQPHQIIVQANGIWLYENLIHMLTLLVNKLIQPQ